MAMINENLLMRVLGEAVVKKYRNTPSATSLEGVSEKENPLSEENTPSKEKASKRENNLFTPYRLGEYQNFKEAFNASGFTPFTADIFGRGEDNYQGKEAKMLDYLTELYIKMYGDGEMEYQKKELEKTLKAIDRLRSYIP
ncbi:MAG: hypothetical protein IJP96_06265 [Synergistaceae bacterium]|nr:hypothetical protein [Synergistaceae bacterium]